MTDEKKEVKLNLSYDWNKLELAQVAEDYLKQGEKGIPLAKKSLELVLQDIGASDPWIIKTITDPDIINKTIKNQLETYFSFKKDQTIKDFINYHGKNIETYVGENTLRLQGELKPFMDKKYGDILIENGKAQHIIEGKEKYDLGSDKDVEGAKKTLEKYQKVMLTIHKLESRKLSQLKNRVEEEEAKEFFKILYPKPKDKK